jgi:alpha-ribazole phosphatase
MKLYLLRHTRVDITSGTCYGQLDVPLAPTYPSEKEQVQNKIGGILFDAVCSSPLSRCRTLAESVSGSMLVQYDPRLMELHFGDWEGKLWAEISREPYASEWFRNFLEVPCPGGESYIQLLSRCKDFLKELKTEYASGNILAVTHGGAIRSLYSIITGIAPEHAFDLKVGYGDIFKLEF